MRNPRAPSSRREAARSASTRWPGLSWNADACGQSISAASRIDTRRVIAAVPWFDLRRLFTGAPPAPLGAVLADADAMVSMPIVTVNLWYDRRVMDDSFVGLPGREMQWVFDKRVAFGRDASHLSLVSSGATRLTGMSRDELTALAAREVADALPAARSARLTRATVVREKQATFSLAPGQPSRPVYSYAHRRPLSRRGLDRHGTARHDRKRGHQRPQSRSVDCGLKIGDCGFSRLRIDD